MAHSYYVSKAGDDRHDGCTEATAWKTLARAAERSYLPGERLLLRAGDVWEEPLALRGSGAPGSPVLLSSHGAGPRPVIRYGAGDVLTLLNPSHWTVRGLEIRLTTPLPLLPEHESYAKGRGDAGEHALNRGIALAFAAGAVVSDILIEDNLVLGPGPDSFTIGIEAHAEFAADSRDGNVRNLTFRGNTVGHVGWVGLQTRAWSAPEVEGTGITRHLPYAQTRLLGNVIYDVGVQGMLLRNAADSLMQGNTVRQVGMYRGTGVTWGPAGLWIFACRDVDIRFNEVCGMLDSNSGYDATGIDIDWGNSERIRVWYNHAHNNFGNGIVTMACRDSEIVGNRVEGNHCIYNCGTGQMALTNYHVDDRPDAIKSVEGLEVRDNLIIIDRPNTCALNTLKSSEGPEWTGNRFAGNRIVVKPGIDPSGLYQIRPEAAVDTIAGNTVYGYRAGDEPEGTGDTFAPAITAAPPACERLTATLTDEGYVALSWTVAGPGDAPVLHYNVHRAKVPGFTPGFTNMIGRTSACAFVDEEAELSPGPTFYAVRAEDACGGYGLVAEADVAR
jgi:hypothetical protein